MPPDCLLLLFDVFVLGFKGGKEVVDVYIYTVTH